jgi:large subunit ribosomal protein L13
MNREVETMRTTYIAKESDVVKKWYVIDAADMTLGRISTEIANILRGKNKPQYATNVDMGDYVVVINAEKVAVTGKKLEQKVYHHHSGYTSGLKTIRLDKMLDTHPERVIEHAVKGMLPKNALGRKMFAKLHVYAGAEHPHAAQKPEKLDIKF